MQEDGYDAGFGMVAGGRGFEPLLAESESAVLPLDEPPIYPPQLISQINLPILICDLYFLVKSVTDTLPLTLTGSGRQFHLRPAKRQWPSLAECPAG